MTVVYRYSIKAEQARLHGLHRIQDSLPEHVSAKCAVASS
jgi:hypothetical protein